MNERKRDPILSGVSDMPCRRCGKRFIPAPLHIYKDKHNHYYCSWTCYLHSDDKEWKKDDKGTT